MLSFLPTFLTVALFATSVLGSADPLLYSYTLAQKRSDVPSGWSHVGKHNPSSVLPLRFGLTQSNIENIEELLLDIADPESPNYGNHWTPSRVAATFRPSEDTIRTVRNWLIRSGIDKDRIKVSHQRTWIELNATVEEAERLLQTEYNVYEHHTGMRHVACQSYHLPTHIVPHVDLVTPTIDFSAVLEKRDSHGPPIKIGDPGFGNHPKTKGGKITPHPPPHGPQSQAGTANCDSQITLDCLRALYGINYTPVSPAAGRFGIVEYTPQAYVPSDIDVFSATYEPALSGKRPTLAAIDGGVVQTSQTGFNYNGESNLDLQYGMGLVGPTQPVTLYQVGDIVEGGSFNNFLDALDGSYCTYEGGDDFSVDSRYPDTNPGGYNHGPDCGTFTPTNVISTSYGYNEADLSPAYAARQCDEYAKLGLMGVTVLYSSGDNGVAGNGGTCLNADGSQSAGGSIFNPTFPSVCPYVTSVGATQINPGSSVTDPESACQQVIFSGGGFSNRFKIPGYQKLAIGTWRVHSLPSYPPTIWNSTAGSRGYPDLSANGANYVTAVGGSFFLVYGTSASTPVVAAMITLINDARITAGKAPVGFINPTIYSTTFKDAFNDITSGNNPGCGTNGYSAVAGWDPVTGLGTPNFPKLLAHFLAM